MRETNRARQAFEDYFLMGPGRSIRKLQQSYSGATANNPPTKHLKTLFKWSVAHGWQNRVLKREAEIASAQLQDIIENAPKTGYAIWQKRVQDLGHIADKLMKLIEIPGLFSPALVREYRGLLGDIASEMGERIKKHEVTGAEEGTIKLLIELLPDGSENQTAPTT